MPIQVTPINTYTEAFIGAPVPRYDPVAVNDANCVAIYNLYKPLILDFFQACNNPRTPKNILKLKTFMTFTKSIYYNHGNPDFFARAVEESLIPEPVDGEYNMDWINKWYTMLFGEVGGEEDLSIVIQGGEAVNFYTAYKYTNVPTHDADTRLLAGTHFNYMTKLANVDALAKNQMHRYRFFISFGLMAYLHAMTRHYLTIPENRTTYTSKFIPQWRGDQGTNPVSVSFTAQWSNSINFYDLILSGLYGGLGNDLRIERLLGVGIRVQIGAFDHQCWVVDYMCPYKQPGNPGEHQYDTSRMRIGQSDNLHTYFSTEQARSTSDTGLAPNPDGQIPSVNFPLTISPDIPLLGNLNSPLNTNPILVRIVPLGFILFETLRMLFVSKTLESNNATNKMMKYKQKLNVLLSTLMREQLSRDVYDYCLDKKFRPANPPILNPENNNGGPVVNLQPILMGGKETVENHLERAQDPQALKQLAQPSFVETLVKEDDLTTQARAFSRKLMEQETAAMNTLLKEKGKPLPKGTIYPSIAEPESMTPAEELGYMDYLSYQHPDFKDFRLPLSGEELKKIKPMPDIPEMILKELLNVTSEQDLKKVLEKDTNVRVSNGGYRRKTPRNKKGKRITRRR